MTRFVMAGLFCVSTSACFFPADRGAVVEQRLDSLSADNESLKKELQDTRTRLDEATGQLQAALDQLDRASRTTGANIGVKVDSALQDVAVLRGQVEAQSVKLGEIEGKLSAQPTAIAGDPKKEDVKRPDEPKAFLALADEKVKGGDVELGRRLYTEFMKKWPKDEQIGEAHYLLGETYFTDSKWREALYEYNQVISNFAKTKSAAQAYLHTAECFKQLKMNDEQRLALEELVKTFPKSDAAKTAKTKLAELRKAKK